MISAMHKEPTFCDLIASFLPTRNMRIQADLVD
jgi:CRP/FNR family cyclic AMP-dependent transcriptional regulator